MFRESKKKIVKYAVTMVGVLAISQAFATDNKAELSKKLDVYKASSMPVDKMAFNDMAGVYHANGAGIKPVMGATEAKAADATVTEEESLDNLSMSDLFNIKVVGVSKGEESIREAPMSISIYSRDEAIRDGSHGMIDMTGRLEGFTNLGTQNFGTRGPLARGLSDIWRYQLSMDLMPFKDWGHMQFSPYWIQNIESVRGPAGMMWGEGAFAGLTNINIRNDLEGFETHLGYGLLNKINADALYGHKFENPGDGFFVGLHYEQCDDEPITLNSANQNFIGGSTLQQYGVLPSWQIVGKFQYKPFKFVFFKDDPQHNSAQDWLNKSFVKTYSDTFGYVDSHLPVTSFRGEYHPLKQFTDKYDVCFYGNYYKKEWYVPRYTFEAQSSYSFGINSELKFLQDKLKVIAGGDFFNQEKAYDPRLDNMKLPVAPTRKSAADTSVLDSKDTSAVYKTWFENYVKTMAGQYPQTTNKRNAYIQGTYKITDYLGVTLGERVDYQKNAKPNELVLSGPRIAFFSNVTPDLTLKLLYNKGYRRPTGNELKNSMVVVPAGTPALDNPKAEQINDLEFVTMYAWKNMLLADVTLFRQEMTDRIVTYASRPTESSPWAGNIGGVRTYGAEFSAKYVPTTSLNAYVKGQFCSAKVFDGFQPGTTLKVAKFLSDNSIPYQPTMSGLIGAEYDVLHYAKINVSERGIYKAPYLELNGSDAFVNAYYTDLSIRSAKFLSRFSVDFNVTNLMDQKRMMPTFAEFYAENPGSVQPEGRRLWVTLNANLW